MKYVSNKCVNEITLYVTRVTPPVKTRGCFGRCFLSCNTVVLMSLLGFLTIHISKPISTCKLSSLTMFYWWTAWLLLICIYFYLWTNTIEWTSLMQCTWAFSYHISIEVNWAWQWRKNLQHLSNLLQTLKNVYSMLKQQINLLFSMKSTNVELLYFRQHTYNVFIHNSRCFYPCKATYKWRFANEELHSNGIVWTNNFLDSK